MFDGLYVKSKNGAIFTNLMSLIASPQNIALAYRRIKRNKGSRTPGSNMGTIQNIAEQGNDVLVDYVISKLLKAPIQGEGIPTKGTPQGGILSPLLSNIVLNELDWWISNQWETFPSEFPYQWSGDRCTALKKTKLKEMYLVRYARKTVNSQKANAP